MKKSFLLLTVVFSLVLLSCTVSNQTTEPTRPVNQDTNTENTTSSNDQTTQLNNQDTTPSNDQIIQSNSQESTPTNNQPSNINQPNVKEFVMTTQQWQFNPSQITVNQGDLVKLRITTLDVKHSIAIPDFNINKDLNPGEETVVEFTADKPGTFTFYCSIYCGEGHKDMKGILVVQA
ncbi:hypothetical protein A2272_00455 [Candidatus Peregrinibacteria bacterium RIFOXYA12_FULL_33_12]|nr:MAG: hypothetical protein A2272_00455 [Candidatus Peregrinibacteria bacterium RIFOXYA12_FULL_33_12]